MPRPPKPFSLPILLIRGLRHYAAVNLAVLAAAAIGVAVLTGALLVGDSMRHSLRALAVEGLGEIDHVLVSDLFFREELADELNQTGARVTPVVILNGAVTHAQTGARANQCSVLGVTPSFWDFGEIDPDWSRLQPFETILNAAMATEIQAKEGDEILLRVPRPSAVPRDSFMGERDETVATLRLTVVRILPDNGLARFSLQTTQLTPLNLFVPLQA
ncbi:ABC transporter permease, partial [bacterium]|nr:ABC transporter permease [bacterium]